jgi:hypothetical protein
MRYTYDAMLSAHFKYAGALGMVANAGKFGLGYATGIPIGTAGTAGMVAGVAKDIAGSAGGEKKPSVMGFEAPTGGGQTRLASLREKGAAFHFKQASGVGHALVHYGPYAAWMASHALDEKHPELARALGIGAAATLGGATLYDMYKNPGQRQLPNAMDVAGLALFGGADLMRYLKQRRA